MSRPSGENLAHQRVRCERRSGVVGVHEQREYERTHDPDGDTNGARGARGVCRRPAAEKTVTELLAGPRIGTSRISRARDAEAAAGPLPWPPTWRARSGSLRLVPRGRRCTGAGWVNRDRPLGGGMPPPSICCSSAMPSRRQARSRGGTHSGRRRSWRWRASVQPADPAWRDAVEAGQDAGGGPWPTSRWRSRAAAGDLASADHVPLVMRTSHRGWKLRSRRAWAMSERQRNSSADASIQSERQDSGGSSSSSPGISHS